jgi:hypothetical protein
VESFSHAVSCVQQLAAVQASHAAGPSGMHTGDTHGCVCPQHVPPKHRPEQHDVGSPHAVPSEPHTGPPLLELLPPLLELLPPLLPPLLLDDPPLDDELPPQELPLPLLDELPLDEELPELLPLDPPLPLPDEPPLDDEPSPAPPSSDTLSPVAAPQPSVVTAPTTRSQPVMRPRLMIRVYARARASPGSPRSRAHFRRPPRRPRRLRQRQRPRLRRHGLHLLERLQLGAAVSRLQGAR